MPGSNLKLCYKNIITNQTSSLKCFLPAYLWLLLLLGHQFTHRLGLHFHFFEGKLGIKELAVNFIWGQVA